VPTQATNDSFENKDTKRGANINSSSLNNNLINNSNSKIRNSSEKLHEQSDSRRLGSTKSTLNSNSTMKTQMNNLLGYGQDRNTHHR